MALSKDDTDMSLKRASHYLLKQLFLNGFGTSHLTPQCTSSTACLPAHPPNNHHLNTYFIAALTTPSFGYSGANASLTFAHTTHTKWSFAPPHVSSLAIAPSTMGTDALTRPPTASTLQDTFAFSKTSFHITHTHNKSINPTQIPPQTPTPPSLTTPYFLQTIHQHHHLLPHHHLHLTLHLHLSLLLKHTIPQHHLPVPARQTFAKIPNLAPHTAHLPTPLPPTTPISSNQLRSTKQTNTNNGAMPWSRNTMRSLKITPGLSSHMFPTPMSSIRSGCSKSRGTNMVKSHGTRHVSLQKVSVNNLALTSTKPLVP